MNVPVLMQNAVNITKKIRLTILSLFSLGPHVSSDNRTFTLPPNREDRPPPKTSTPPTFSNTTSNGTESSTGDSSDDTDHTIGKDSCILFS